MNKLDVIRSAESAFLHGKRGTFAIARTSEGSLRYFAPGVQTEVRFLRIKLHDRVFDVNSFAGLLIMRYHPKKRSAWFVFYDLNNSKHPYIASSLDEVSAFSLSAVADAPNIPEAAEDPIVVQAVFDGRSNVIFRTQSMEAAAITILNGQVAEPSYTYSCHTLEDKPTSPECGGDAFSALDLDDEGV